MPTRPSLDPTPTPYFLVGLALVAAWNSLLLAQAPFVFMALNGESSAGLFAALFGLALLVGVAALILRAATGRQRVAAAFASGLSGPAIVFLLFSFPGPTSMFAYLPLISIAAGTLAAFIGGIFLKAGVVRIAGVTALFAALALVAAPPLIARQDRHNANEARIEAGRQAEIDSIVEDGVLPTIADAPGMTPWQVVSNGQHGWVWMQAEDGGVLGIATDTLWTETISDVDVCITMVPELYSLDDAARQERYSEFCGSDGPGRWHTLDGTGIAVVLNGLFVVLSTASSEETDSLGFGHPASTAQLADAAAHLRPVTRDELRYYMEHPVVDPDGQPQHPTG